MFLNTILTSQISQRALLLTSKKIENFSQKLPIAETKIPPDFPFLLDQMNAETQHSIK